ncbi:phage tail protein [Campylobacter sp. RM13119]|uniref:phage tail-collar fiber domain-containing protein n=1 Tax=Campylobacter californiensis TaxID=1032243 RepID=UPI0014735E9D|nr:phage tail protein [Campylobacter sp. RM13119]MBE3607064.1 phage tail protein [Campylobacter sp. RM13119]
MDYFSILTNTGLNKLIKATANNAQIVLTQMGVSDSTQPITQDLTELPSIKHKFSINTITQSESDANVLICEGVISADVGGFYIRRVGIYTDDGILFAVGVVPESYKPLLSEGSSKDITIKFYLQVDNAANITLKVDNNIVLATRSHVADELKKLDAKFLPLTSKAYDSDKLDGKDSSEYVLKSEISDGLKIGSYLLWSSEAVTPAGFLVCDGRSLNKSKYIELFNIIGYTYGGGGESFNIPKFNDGRFMRSLGGNALPLGQLQQDGIKSHNHKLKNLVRSDFQSGSGRTGSLVRADQDFFQDDIMESTGGAETRPLNSSVIVLIKAKDVKEPNVSQIDTTLYASETKAGIVKLKNSINGNAEDTAVTEKAIRSFMNQTFFSLKAANGYTKLPNGLIMQWGIMLTKPYIVGDRENNIIFPIAFPNGCFGGWWSANYNNKAGDATSILKDFTNSGMIFENWLGTSLHIRWFAIGH